MANPKIQLRHDTSTNWQTQNPILLEGEVAIETDSNKVKIGNGTDNYNTLPYITDQTKIDLDYSNADYQPVDKAGDTMTGDLIIDKNGAGYVTLQSSFDSTTTTAPSGYTGLGTFSMRDTNGRTTGYIENAFNTNNVVTLGIGARRIIGGVNKTASLGLSVDASGVASSSFPNTTCVDGQWNYINTRLMNAVSLTGTTKLTYTLTNIPADGHNYEVLLSGNCGVSATANNVAYLYISSDLIQSTVQLCRFNTRANNSHTVSGNAILPVSSSRNIYVERANDNNGTANLWLLGYRRIGTNA